MKYCVLASLQASIPLLRNQTAQAIRGKLAGKHTWGELKVSEEFDEDGKPIVVVIARFDKKEDMNELYNLIKDRIERIPVLKGKVKKHICGHDEGKPCESREEYVKV